MKKTKMGAMLMVLVAIGMVGCCGSGIKITVVNNLDKAVDAEFLTQGGPEHEALYKYDEILAGKTVTHCRVIDDEMLPCPFSFTIYGGTADSLTEIITIPINYRKKNFEKLRVEINSDEELGKVIKFYDAKGKPILTR